MPARLLLSSILAATLLGACTRTPSPGTDEASDAAQGRDSVTARSQPASGGVATREQTDYYAALVAKHGEDLSECPPADNASADACAAGDTPDAAPPRRVLLMLDASGSMAARQGGATKLAAAQDALLDFVRRLEGDAQVALRVYGHRGSNREADKAASCRGTELVQPFAARDVAGFETAVRSFQPRGFTPIAASLQAAAQDFARGDANASGNVVYLVSDGIETCDGDPAAAAGALNASDIRVVVNVIGFDVDAQAENQLRGVAESGGGEYLEARNGADLTRVFNERMSALTARFNCRMGEQTRAFNRTVGTNTARFNCLTGKATREFNAVTGAANSDFNADRATRAQYDYAQEQARRKREAIIEPAKSTYETVTESATEGYRDTTDDARKDYEGERDAANAERN